MSERLPFPVAGRASYTIDARELLTVHLSYDRDLQLSRLRLEGQGGTRIELNLNLVSLLSLLEQAAEAMAADPYAIGQEALKGNDRLTDVLERLRAGHQIAVEGVPA